jgi:hypothetical protein
MELSEMEILLSKISGIIKRNGEQLDLTGERFNIFSILNVETKEILHSKFLAELLNKNGTHGCGSRLLELFVKQLNLKIDLNSTKVRVEKYVGKIADDNTKGGSIDILLKDSNGKAIVVENKIYAKDQNNQLLRYYNAHSDSHILYLSLYGQDASEESKRSLQKEIDYHCISYKNDILSWLLECRKELAIKPLVRETITQYINLIKLLTGQTISKQMDNEIIDNILSSEETLSAWKKIASNEIQIKVKKTLVLSIFGRIEKLLISKNFSIKEKISLTDRNTAKYKGMLVSFENDLSKKNNLLLRMNFEETSFTKLIIGFYDESKSGLVNIQLFERFKTYFPDVAQKSKLYPAYILNTPYCDWWTNKLKEIYFHYVEFENDLINKIDKMILTLEDEHNQRNANT